MNPRPTTLAAALSTAAAAAVCAALAGCSTQADAKPAPSTTTAAGASTTPRATTTPSTSTSTSLDPAAREAKDRQDAEAVWRKFDLLTYTMTSLSPDQANQAIEQLSVDPVLTRMKTAYQTLTSRNEEGYGADISSVSWRQPINGGTTATLFDCQDGSQAGYRDKKTGNKLTAGTPNTPVTGTLQRTPEGWKVANFVYDQVNKCTPGE